MVFARERVLLTRAMSVYRLGYLWIGVPSRGTWTFQRPILQGDRASEQARANGTILELPGTEPRLFTAALPVRSQHWPQPPRHKPPSMRADTTDILKGLLGLGEPEIDELVATGVVGLERRIFTHAGRLDIDIA